MTRLFCTSCGASIGVARQCGACGAPNEFVDFGDPPPVFQFQDVPPNHFPTSPFPPSSNAGALATVPEGRSSDARRPPRTRTGPRTTRRTDPDDTSPPTRSPRSPSEHVDAGAGAPASSGAARRRGDGRSGADGESPLSGGATPDDAHAPTDGAAEAVPGETTSILDERAGPENREDVDKTLLLDEIEADPVVATLERLSRPGEGTIFELRVGVTTLGASGTTIEFDRKIDLAISRRHARVEISETPRGLQASVSDLGSSNGTFVDKKRVRAPSIVADGSILTLGNIDFRFRYSEPAESKDEPRRTVVLEPSVRGWEALNRRSARGARRLANEPVAALERVQPPDSGKLFPLARGTTTIGTEDADISFDPDIDDATSRKHAKIDIERIAGEWKHWVIDLYSSNGTYVDGELIKAGTRAAIHDGAILRLGRLELRFHADPSVLDADSRGVHGAKRGSVEGSFELEPWRASPPRPKRDADATPPDEDEDADEPPAEDGPRKPRPRPIY
jgi:pSer/pThr/pTyr-binding forkhead associated (FHA) protein